MNGGMIKNTYPDTRKYTNEHKYRKENQNYILYCMSRKKTMNKWVVVIVIVIVIIIIGGIVTSMSRQVVVGSDSKNSQYSSIHYG